MKNKTKFLLPALLAATLATAGLSGVAAAAGQPVDFIGKAAPAQGAVNQVIVITDATRYVNVTGGSTVRFVVGDQAFAWSFETGAMHVFAFDLSKIAPPGLLKHPVTVYVADNPLYQGN